MNPKKKVFDDSGVSEVIGTILLLSLSVTLFSVVYVSVLSFPGAPTTPSSNVAFSLNETSILLYHMGGKPIKLDAQVKIRVNDTSYMYPIAHGLNTESEKDGYWGFGELFQLNLSEVGISPSTVDYSIDVTVIDIGSNSVVLSGQKMISNRSPIIGSPFPYNTSVNVPIDITHLNITIFDPDSDAFCWSIETNPDIGENSGSMQEYTQTEFSCSITTTLTPDRVYFWFVNATDVNGESTNKTFMFTTGYSEDRKDAVDSNTSTVDSSPDLGNETNFLNAQANITDTAVMTIQESNSGNQNYVIAVQGNTTNVDSSADLGSETNFINCQQTICDNNNMNLVESLSGLPAVSEYNYVNSFTATSTGWTTSGTTPYISAVGGGYISTSTNGAVERWFTFGDTASTGDNLVVELQAYITAGDGNDDITVNIDTNGDNTAEYTATISNPTNGWYTTGILSNLNTHAAVNSARASFTHTKSGGAYTITIDCARLYVTRASTINYRLDVEYNWSTASFSEQTKQLCFYVQSHTGGTEQLMVKYWTGSTWSLLGNITTVGWTNLTAVGLTSGTYTIRVNGSSASNDVIQDTWDIDCMFLHCYNGTNYRIDLEYQWTNADFNEAHEQVCMYITSKTGTETLNINYRNGAVWVPIGSITGTGWVNITATGLSSATYTIQFIGATETNDSEKDSWNIDCLYLHTWT